MRESGWRRGWLVLPLLLIAWIVIDRKIEARRSAAEAEEVAFRASAAGLRVRLMSCYRASQTEVEATLTDGRTLPGIMTLNVGGAMTEDERSLFPLGLMPDDNFGVSPSGQRTYFRSELAGNEIGREYDGWTIRLHFLNDRLSGAYYTPAPRTPYLGPSIACHATRAFRRGLMACGVIGWVACIALAIFKRAERRTLAKLALAMICLTALAWCLDTTSVAWAPRLVQRFGYLLLGAAVVVTAGISLLPSRRQTAEGHDACMKCGYDLMGNESGICPECGTVISARAAQRWTDEAQLMEALSSADPNLELQDVELGWATNDELPMDSPPATDGSRWNCPSEFRGVDSDDDSRVLR